MQKTWNARLPAAAREHEREPKLTMIEALNLARQTGKGIAYQNAVIRDIMLDGLDPVAEYPDIDEMEGMVRLADLDIKVGEIVDIGSFVGQGVGPNRSCIVEWGKGEDDAVSLDLTPLGESEWRRWDLGQKVAVDLRAAGLTEQNAELSARNLTLA